jgi:hypothetical protein
MRQAALLPSRFLTIRTFFCRPNQGGYSHVNEKSFDDVRDMFMLRGMTPDESAGQRLREAASVPWLATNTQVFRWAMRRD